jgi:chaperonin GroEL (HSP60 family)
LHHNINKKKKNLVLILFLIVNAVLVVANVVKSSFGPEGLDKMIVDDIGDVTISNDGATILKLLDVEHPAAKHLVQLADLQDQEVGDGTTSVVILAAEILKVCVRVLFFVIVVLFFHFVV